MVHRHIGHGSGKFKAFVNGQPAYKIQGSPVFLVAAVKHRHSGSLLDCCGSGPLHHRVLVDTGCNRYHISLGISHFLREIQDAAAGSDAACQVGLLYVIAAVTALCPVIPLCKRLIIIQKQLFDNTLVQIRHHGAALIVMVDIRTHGMIHGHKIVGQVIHSDKGTSISVRTGSHAVRPLKISLSHPFQAFPRLHVLLPVLGIGLQKFIQPGLVHEKKLRGFCHRQYVELSVDITLVKVCLIILCQICLRHHTAQLHQSVGVQLYRVDHHVPVSQHNICHLHIVGGAVEHQIYLIGQIRDRALAVSLHNHAAFQAQRSIVLLYQLVQMLLLCIVIVVPELYGHGSIAVIFLCQGRRYLRLGDFSFFVFPGTAARQDCRSDAKSRY